MFIHNLIFVFHYRLHYGNKHPLATNIKGAITLYIVLDPHVDFKSKSIG